MRITVSANKMILFLDILTKFVAKNSTLPILQNIYMKSEIDTLILRATDMEKYVEIQYPCEVSAEWAITVDAKMFYDILKSSIDSSKDWKIELTVNQKTEVLNIKTENDLFDLNWIPASEYIALPEIPKDNKVTIWTELFSEWVNKVEYSVTEKNFSPVLTWVLITSKKTESWNDLVFVWTDSFRLSEFKIKSEWIDKDFSVLIPKINILDIKKINDLALDNWASEIELSYSKNLIAFEYNILWAKILATSLLIQWDFPNYDREDIMPTSFNSKIIVDKSLCEKAIRKIAILTRDMSNYIQISTIDNWIEISSWQTDKWAWKTNIPAIISWENITFWLNWKYISDFIRTMKWSELIFNIVDNSKPLILEDKELSNYKYVIRPLIK